MKKWQEVLAIKGKPEEPIDRNRMHGNLSSAYCDIMKAASELILAADDMIGTATDDRLCSLSNSLKELAEEVSNEIGLLERRNAG